MALTDASRVLEPPTAQAIGWDGQTLLQMLTGQERLFEETGRYYGLETLDLQRGDPIRYEKIFSRLRGGLVSARETAMNISASPIVKEIGELSFMLTRRGRLDRPFARDHRPCPYRLGRDQVHDPCRVRGRPRDPARRHPSATTTASIGDVHNADVLTIVPIFWDEELIGWAAGVTHEIDIGAKTPGSVPVGRSRGLRMESTSPRARSARRQAVRGPHPGGLAGHADTDVLDARRAHRVAVVTWLAKRSSA